MTLRVYCWLLLVVIDVNPWKNTHSTKDEFQIGPLMVKSLTGRRFADWVILEVWIELSIGQNKKDLIKWVFIINIIYLTTQLTK